MNRALARTRRAEYGRRARGTSWIAALGLLAHAGAGEIFTASLVDGDYGGGVIVDTMDPDHGGAPHMPGVVDSPDGVTFTSTETSGRSNGLVNYALGASRSSFLTSGTIAMVIEVDAANHVGGELFGDNYGYTAFRHGQGTFSASATRLVNENGPEDDQVRISWKTWHSNVWYTIGSATIDYGQNHELGFTWGGAEHDYELWIDGELAVGYHLPNGVHLPWGISWGSATNLGLGSNHERGYAAYGSVVGLTYSDLRIWDEYRPMGDTVIPPEPSPIPFNQRLAIHLDAAEGVFTDQAGTQTAAIGSTVNRWQDSGPLNGDNYAHSGYFHGGGQWNAPVLAQVGFGEGLNRDHAAIRFNGAHGLVAEMSGDSVAGINDQEVTVVSVSRVEGREAQIICGGRYGQVDEGWSALYGMAWYTGCSGDSGYFAAARTDETTLTDYSSSDPINTFVIQSMVHEGYDGDHWQAELVSSDGLELFRDTGPGVDAEIRDLRVDPSFPSPIFDALAIGRSDSSPGGYLTGEIAELMIYEGALTTEELAEVEAYLWRKYFEVPLPVTMLDTSGDVPKLVWDSLERFNYQVIRSTDLMNWDPISEVLTGSASGVMQIPVTFDAPPPGRYFYRISVTNAAPQQ